MLRSRPRKTAGSTPTGLTITWDHIARALHVFGCVATYMLDLALIIAALYHTLAVSLSSGICISTSLAPSNTEGRFASPRRPVLSLTSCSILSRKGSGEELGWEIRNEDWLWCSRWGAGKSKP